MINNFLKIASVFFFLFYASSAKSLDEFNFDVTEIEITNNGNIFKGFNRGTITTDDGIILDADNFIYNKDLNILNASGNVEIKDTKNNYTIISEKITYFKNEDIIISEGKSTATSKDDNIYMQADIFEYHKSINKIIAENNVVIDDKENNNKIFSNKITYFKNQEKFITEGKTKALIEENYDFNSEDVLFLRKENQLSSKKNTTIFDNKSQFYKLSNFLYSIESKELKGENIIITTNYNLPKSDTFYFSSAIVNLKNNKYVAAETEIKVHKNIFSNKENDPRILGISSKSDGNKTILNKAIFTSCKKNDNCPPWSISANKIEHDKKKKLISYEHAYLKVYDKTVFYFPKFFHPDPTVNRQSGFLKPTINNSNVLGSSLTIPYFAEIDLNKDFTLKPTWFDSDIIMFQNEYRQANESTKFLADFGFIQGFKSSTTNKKKNINHFFLNLNHDLNLDNFDTSEFNLSVAKTNNDTYLKIFDPHITKSSARPDSFNTLKNKLELILNHSDYNFDTGVISYEDLQVAKKSDRYQYILPYYNFDKILDNNFFKGSLTFSSKGDNHLNNTNQLKSSIINDFAYKSSSFISRLGVVNDADIHVKNLNSTGKNSEYKSSLQSEIVSVFSLNSSFPLKKVENEYQTFLIPKASIRINPSDMKNYSSSNKTINVGNIFNINRLGLSDTHEAGRSLTLGIDFKKEKLGKNNSDSDEIKDINKYFEFKLATVLRDKENNFIPKSSTINRKSSNIFGSIDNNLFENLKIKYDFALDNDLNELEYNNLMSTIKFGDFETTFNFIEENGEMGDSNILENSFSYKLDNFNSVTFNTRRNRKLNLTEYYDLVYEYQNDCLTAGIKYKKTYYEDRELKPTENLLFTITLFPLTTYEYSADELVDG